MKACRKVEINSKYNDFTNCVTAFICTVNNDTD